MWKFSKNSPHMPPKHDFWFLITLFLKRSYQTSKQFLWETYLDILATVGCKMSLMFMFNAKFIFSRISSVPLENITKTAILPPFHWLIFSAFFKQFSYDFCAIQDVRKKKIRVESCEQSSNTPSPYTELLNLTKNRCSIRHNTELKRICLSLI